MRSSARRFARQTRRKRSRRSSKSALRTSAGPRHPRRHQPADPPAHVKQAATQHEHKLRMEIEMTDALTTDSKTKSRRKAPAGRLFVLELSHQWIRSMSPDGSDRKVLVTECHLPDGITLDVAAGHIYWTNMGSSPAANDGSIERADLDGRNRKVIVPPGVTFTPKQIQLDKTSGKLYWCDRAGMRVMRSNLDGSQIETLIETGRGDADRRDQTRWCVGVAIDPERKQIYWTKKGPDNGEQGRLSRAGLEIPR